MDWWWWQVPPDVVLGFVAGVLFGVGIACKSLRNGERARREP